MTSLRSLGILVVLAGVVATTSPALQRLGVGAFLLGFVLCLAAFWLSRRKRR